MTNNELEQIGSNELDKVTGLAAREKRITRLNQATWTLWWAGTILIVLSWFKVVSNTVGWIGFAAALASTFVSVIAGKYWKFPR
jgi:hypothetical protein